MICQNCEYCKGIKDDRGQLNITCDMKGLVRVHSDYSTRYRCSFYIKSNIAVSAQVLRMAIINNKELYEAFVASVESALRETIVVWEEEEYHDIATRVTDRIIDKI